LSAATAWSTRQDPSHPRSARWSPADSTATAPCRQQEGLTGLSGLDDVRPARTQRELVDYVRQAPQRTRSALQRHGFTLRMVYAAAQAGDIVVDDTSGDLIVATRL